MNNKPYPRAKFGLRASKIIPGEVGLFTLIEFKKGDVVVENSNWDETRLISWEEFNKIDDSTKRQLIYFCHKTPEGIHAPQDINKINIAYFINHSCDPSLFYDTETFNYVAKRDVGIGEELTIDVETIMEKHIFSFECKCGSTKCRKEIKI